MAARRRDRTIARATERACGSPPSSASRRASSPSLSSRRDRRPWAHRGTFACPTARRTGTKIRDPPDRAGRMRRRGRTPRRRPGRCREPRVRRACSERCVDDRELGQLALSRSARATASGSRSNATTRSQPPPASRAVATATERRVDVDAALPQPQGGHSLIEKNGPMGHSAFFHRQISTGRRRTRHEVRARLVAPTSLTRFHGRHCFVSFRRASTHERSTTSSNAVDIRTSASTSRQGK